MSSDKIQKQRAAALRANERLAAALAKDADSKRKRRDGRLLKLGVLAEQMFLAGDLSLLSRFEAAATEQFASRKIDRLDFELDEDMNWFDKTREEAMLRKSQKAAEQEATKASSAASATSAQGATSPGAGAKAGSAQSARPNGSAGSGASANGHSASAAGPGQGSSG